MITPQNALTMRASIATRPTTAPGSPRAHSRGALQVVGAATKEKKNRDLERLRDLASAEETFLVAGFNYKGLTVRSIAHDRAAQRRGRRASARVRSADDAAGLSRLGHRPGVAPRRGRLFGDGDGRIRREKLSLIHRERGGVVARVDARVNARCSRRRADWFQGIRATTRAEADERATDPFFLRSFDT